MISSILYSQDANSQIPSNKNRSNSIYLQNFIIIPTLNYDRVIPLNEDVGIIPKIGIGVAFTSMPVFDVSFYVKNGKHSIEVGAGYWDFEGSVINGNYRYIGNRGLLIKAGLHYIPGEEAAPIIAIGYSF